MPVDMRGNPYILSIYKVPANVLQFFISAARTGKLILRDPVLMDNDGKLSYNLFLGALLLPLVTRNFNSLRLSGLRNGSRFFPAENAQLYDSILHGRNTDLLTLPAKVEPLQVLKHLHDVRHTSFQLSNALVPLPKLLLFPRCILFKRGDVLSNIRANIGLQVVQNAEEIVLDKPEVKVMVNPGGLNEKFAHENLSHSSIIVHQKNEEIPTLVAEGKADVMITEITEAPYYVQADSRLAAPLLSKPFNHGEIGILMRKGQDDLLQVVNDIIRKMKRNGTLRRLKKEWGF